MNTCAFSFEDAVHTHLTIGFVDGCLACAQTMTDLALSHEAHVAKAAPTRFAKAA